MPFPPFASCRNLDLPPVNLRFLQSHLTKNAFAIAPTHLCGIAYIPVVLWADTLPIIGMLMIPKTCAYVWTVLIGYSAMKKEC